MRPYQLLLLALRLNPTLKNRALLGHEKGCWLTFAFGRLQPFTLSELNGGYVGSGYWQLQEAKFRFNPKRPFENPSFVILLVPDLCPINRD